MPSPSKIEGEDDLRVCEAPRSHMRFASCNRSAEPTSSTSQGFDLRFWGRGSPMQLSRLLREDSVMRGGVVNICFGESQI